MASTVTELLRRRFGGGKKTPKVVRGSFTVAEDGRTQTITHNIDAQNYIVMCKNKNMRTDVDALMEIVIIRGIAKYKFYISNSYRDTAATVCEARGGSSYTVTNNTAQLDNYCTDNTTTISSRNSAYQFLKDDEYEWIVISLDNVDLETTKTLDTSAQYMSVDNSLGTTSIFSACLIDSPTFTVNGCLASFNFNAYLSQINSLCFEVRSSYNDYSYVFSINSPTITDSTVQFRTRSASYMFETGDYTILMTKI